MTEFFEWRDAPAARFGVIGDPITHSLSPKMQNAALRALGESGEYVAVRVPATDACRALDRLAQLGYEGVNVTVPNKAAVLPWLAAADPFAHRVGAVNTIDLRNRRGINTDGDGFTDTLADLGIQSGHALILGAGGSARSVVAALSDAGFVVCIWNRTRARAEVLCRDLNMAASVVPTPDLSGFGLIVNATSSSLQEDQGLDLDWANAEPGATAYDLSYPAERSDFLRQASERGLNVVDGIPLLVAQGARSLEWWLGKSAPRDVMLEALR